MWLLIATVAPITGCPTSKAERAEDASDQGLLGVWSGRFESDDGCTDGWVQLQTFHNERGGYTAIYDYRSDSPGDPDDRAHARYTLEGGGNPSHMALTSIEREADELSDGVWCNGSFDLELLPAPGYLTRLAYKVLDWPLPSAAVQGSWVATDCSCTGTLELIPGTSSLAAESWAE